MKNLVIFDLPAVVRYDHLPLRKALITTLESVIPQAPVLRDIIWSQNAAGVIRQIFNRTCNRLPADEEMEQITLAFHQNLKEYFLLTEDPFDVWSGVQNIFESLDKRPDWDYFIISDYWRKSTEFILDSCGIFSRKKHLLTAEDGLSASEIIKNLDQNDGLDGNEVVYLMARDIHNVEKPAAGMRLEKMHPPHRRKADVLEYPRFTQLFSSSELI